MHTDGVPYGLVTIEHFLVSEELHPDFEMPVLQRPVGPSLRLITVQADAIRFRFSAQHDCRLVDCQPTALHPIVQERQETAQSTKLISHGDDDHFIVNMAALHNATLLRRALPIALTVPRPLYSDRKAHHYGIAVGLRVSQVMKRARTQEKRKATMAAKALKKGSAQVIVKVMCSTAEAPAKLILNVLKEGYARSRAERSQRTNGPGPSVRITKVTPDKMERETEDWVSVRGGQSPQVVGRWHVQKILEALSMLEDERSSSVGKTKLKVSSLRSFKCLSSTFQVKAALTEMDRMSRYSQKKLIYRPT
ncbi:hypothetical protein DFH07DRAFT_773023 [Mycena maculata]|uniref:Uncharacterized protein n=1 Tax=Mycena maculata TaxID=230809 RepID=A0AAD7J489_9AGAR|nr:hypothetical protein DFH07DRAFT_773023 [Mycena maculata]